jgi:tight adherence protein B
VSVVVWTLGAGMALGLLLIATGLRPAPRRAAATRRSPVAGKAPAPGRVVLAAATVVGVLMVTRWPVLAGAAGAAVWWLSGRQAQTQETTIERTEALATWAEMLRDATSTPRGIEGVLVSTASSAPLPIRAVVVRFTDRLTYEPLEAALPDLAENLDHPVADQIVASIGLTATSGAREIRAVLDDLATAARDEARMLRRLEVSRQRPRSDMRQVIVIVTAVIAALSLVGRSYLAPYSSLGGQLVLAVAGALWIGGFAWMSRLGRIEAPSRFITAREVIR